MSTALKGRVLSPIRQVPDGTAALVFFSVWVLSFMGVELALRADIAGASALTFVVAVAFLLISSWHLLWVALAWLSTRPQLPAGIQQDLSGFVTRWGTSAAKKTLRVTTVGAATTASLALTIPASFAFDGGQNPDLLWSDTTTENTIVTPAGLDLGWSSPLAEPFSDETTTTTGYDTLAETVVPEFIPPVEGPSQAVPSEAAFDNSMTPANQAEDTETSVPGTADNAAADVRPHQVNVAVPDLSLSAVDGPSATISSVNKVNGPSPLSAVFSKFVVPQPGKTSAGKSQDFLGALKPPLVTATVAPTKVEAEPHANYEVQEGDNLWSIAANHLERAGAGTTANEINSLWQEIYNENEQVVGADPNLIFVGMKLAVTTG